MNRSARRKAKPNKQIQIKNEKALNVYFVVLLLVFIAIVVWAGVNTLGGVFGA